MNNMIEKDGLTLSIRDGLNMPFMYKGEQVVAHNAAWSFREKIWVNDDLVVNELGFSMSSTHTISVAGDSMEIHFGYRDRMQTIFLEARVDGALVYEVHQGHSKLKPFNLLLFLIAGLATGYGAATLVNMLFGGN